jgi:hypothetical protein
MSPCSRTFDPPATMAGEPEGRATRVCSGPLPVAISMLTVVRGHAPDVPAGQLGGPRPTVKSRRVRVCSLHGAGVGVPRRLSEEQGDGYSFDIGGDGVHDHRVDGAGHDWPPSSCGSPSSRWPCKGDLSVLVYDGDALVAEMYRLRLTRVKLRARVPSPFTVQARAAWWWLEYSRRRNSMTTSISGHAALTWSSTRPSFATRSILYAAPPSVESPRSQARSHNAGAEPDRRGASPVGMDRIL